MIISKDVKELVITRLSLTDSLEVSNCPYLEELDCSHNQLTSLIINDCPELRIIVCDDNPLTELNLGNNLNLEKIECFFGQLTLLNLPPASLFLTELDLRMNKLTGSPTWLVNAPNLLFLKLRKNPLTGSLAVFNKLTKLAWLDIGETNLASDLEYLPAQLARIEAVEMTEINQKMKDYYCDDRYYDYPAWRQANVNLITLTQQLQELKRLKHKIKIILFKQVINDQQAEKVNLILSDILMSNINNQLNNYQAQIEQL